MRTRVHVKGFKIFSDRHGKMRCYHRASRTAVDLSRFPIGSAGFLAECQRITGLSQRVETTKPGTLGSLINQYRAHPEYQDRLAPRTKKDYQKIFDYLKPIVDTPLMSFTPPLVVGIRDKAQGKIGWKAANTTIGILSVLFRFGFERGYVKQNPAAGIRKIPRPKHLPRPNRPWKDSERHKVLDALPPHMAVPFNLMMYCGLDPKDALTLPRTAIKDGMIDTRRAKTGEPVWIPVPAPVFKAMAAAPDHNAITVCANSYGRPWTTTGFNCSWYKIRKKLLLAETIESGLTLKGLRHTVATILAEMGFDDRTIADMLGQRTLAMAQHYSDRADRSKKLGGVIEDFNAELNRRRTKTVKPSKLSVKP